jgi:glyoxylase-like metal-dependent hydrolase (beta-lactamase superfamily II)
MVEVSGKYHVGSLELRTVADGLSRIAPQQMFPNAPESEFGRWIEIGEDGLMEISISSLVFRSHGKTILVDTGLGVRTKRPTSRVTGQLLNNLGALGVAPEAVDVVINTHAHFDHVGWNTHDHDDHTHLTFPNATYYLLREEFEHYTSEEQMEAAPHLRHDLLPLKGSGRLELAEDGTMVTPEVRISRSPGHTAGHICVAITSGGETAVFLGDLTHHPAEFANPEWMGAYDLLPQVLLETRRRLMREAVERDFLLLTAHHAFPGVGKAVDTGERIEWRSVAPPAPGGV